MRMRSGSVSPEKGNTAKPSPRVQADRTISKPESEAPHLRSSGSNCANAAAVPRGRASVWRPVSAFRRKGREDGARVWGEYRQPDLNPTDRSHENAHIKTPSLQPPRLPSHSLAQAPTLPAISTGLRPILMASPCKSASGT